MAVEIHNQDELKKVLHDLKNQAVLIPVMSPDNIRDVLDQLHYIKRFATDNLPSLSALAIGPILKTLETPLARRYTKLSGQIYAPPGSGSDGAENLWSSTSRFNPLAPDFIPQMRAYIDDVAFDTASKTRQELLEALAVFDSLPRDLASLRPQTLEDKHALAELEAQSLLLKRVIAHHLTQLEPAPKVTRRPANQPAPKPVPKKTSVDVGILAQQARVLAQQGARAQEKAKKAQKKSTAKPKSKAAQALKTPAFASRRAPGL